MPSGFTGCPARAARGSSPEFSSRPMERYVMSIRRSARAAVWPVLLGSLALASPATIQATDAACAECHQDVTVSAGAHADTACTECHVNITSVPHDQLAPGEKLDAGAICAGCHGVATQATRQERACRKELQDLPRAAACGGFHRGLRVAHGVRGPDQDLRQVPRRCPRGIRVQRPRAGPAQVGPHGGGTVLQRLPRQPRHPARRETRARGPATRIRQKPAASATTWC